MEYRDDLKITDLKYHQLNELAEFMANSGFLWNDKDLLCYIIDTLSENISDNIIVTHNNRIVGCNLIISTIASINGNVTKIKWSHSTYLAPPYRKDIGLTFFLTTCNINNMWGYGLTPINKRLHELNGTNIYAYSNAYKIRIRTKKNRYEGYFPDCFIQSGMKFQRCYDAVSHNMPNSGLWNKDLLDVDFIRDNNFMHRRFYASPFNYYIYKVGNDINEDILYFVLRVRRVKDVVSFFLVDYRFSINEHSLFTKIIDAIEYLAKINNISDIYIFSTLQWDLINDTRLFPYGKPAIIICNSEIKNKSHHAMVTPADSDCDLIPVQ